MTNETEFANQDEEISVDWRMTALRMANKAKEIENFHFERYQKAIKEQGEDTETPEKDAISNRWAGAKQVADEMCEMATNPFQASNCKAEEISYKDMWLELKRHLQDVLNELTYEYETCIDVDASLRDIDETLAAMEAHRCVLDHLEYIEWKRENPTLAKETVAERVLRLWEEEKLKGEGK